MKPFKLREEKKFIKVLKEPELNKPKVNKSRIVYLAIALILMILLISRISNSLLFISAEGQVVVPKQKISFSYDIRVSDIYINKGEQVTIGDTLFSYMILDNTGSDHSFELNKPVDWIVKSKQDLLIKIRMAELMIDKLQKQLSMLMHNSTELEGFMMQGVHDIYDDYLRNKNDVELTSNEIQHETENLKLLKLMLSRLNGVNNQYNSLQFERFSRYEQLQYFIATTEGMVSDIFYSVDEICYEKDEFLTIHNMADVKVQTYFDPFEINDLKTGDMVLIDFPDGSSTMGLIDKFQVSTYALPSEFQKKYEPTERNVVAEILPYNQSDFSAWKQYYKMEVAVRKPRFGFLYQILS